MTEPELTEEDKAAVLGMVSRRVKNTGETWAVAAAHVAAYLRDCAKRLDKN